MTTQSKKNLKAAFASESQANRRYLAFSKKATEEGFHNIARLFQAVAESETIHAFNHLKSMDEVKSTLENVKVSLQGEQDEILSMYPMFVDQAKRDTDNDALNSFFWAKEAEKTHSAFYERALESLKDGKDLELKELHICVICGYTVEGDPPDKCPNCGVDKNQFQLVT